MGGTLAHARLTARRIAQTPAAFANWPIVLRDLAAQSIGRGPDALTFVVRDGLVVRCPNRPGARVPVFEMFAEDTYRLAWLVGDLAGRPIRAIDVGGHVGTFAVSLMHRHPQAQTTSYEPSATTADFLRENIARNGFTERARIVRAAVASTSGTATFADNGAGSGQNGLASAGHGTGAATEVRTVAFADAVAAAGGPVDLVKIDCEGGEYDIVLGSDVADWAQVTRVVLEYHPVPGRSWQQLRERFEQAGLSVAHHDTGGDGYGCAWLSRTPLPAFPG